MLAAMSSDMSSKIDGVQSTVAASLGDVKTVLTGTVSTLLRAYDTSAQKRFAHIEGGVAHLSKRLDVLEMEAKADKKHIASLQSFAHLCENEIPPPFPPPGWDSPPNGTIIKVNAKEIIPLVKLKETLQPWLEGETGFSSDKYSISAGNDAGANTNFVIQFLGSKITAGRDVSHALQFLQNIDKSYKEFYCNTGPRNVRFYCGRDQNSKTIQTIIQSRNLARAFQKIDDKNTYTHRKRDGAVLRNKVPIAQVEPKPNGADPAVGFFPGVMAESKVDEQKVLDAFKAARPIREIEAVRWCS
jgi:hypothetical protein